MKLLLALVLALTVGILLIASAHTQDRDTRSFGIAAVLFLTVGALRLTKKGVVT